MFADEIFDNPLALQVFRTDTAEFIFESLPAVFGPHPLNSVEPFLKDVVWTWLEINLLPLPQAIAKTAFVISIVAAQRRNLSAIIGAIDSMDQVRILASPFRPNCTPCSIDHFFRGDTRANHNIVPFVLEIRNEFCNCLLSIANKSRRKERIRGSDGASDVGRLLA